MCGIAGMIVGTMAPPPDPEALARMAAMLVHRGPDGWGLYHDRVVGLAHTRLAIVDRAGGHQPMANEDGRFWVTFNGEIFNHVELRAELERRGHRFRTRCDTEVVVHAFEEWGVASWSLFNGQFAFALWDAWRRRLWLVRDRLGILPLFFVRAGETVVFASEAKALFASGAVRPRFDPVRLSQVFTQWSVAPHGSVFMGVEQVPPGGAVGIGTDLEPESERWWRPDFTADPSPRSLDEESERLEERLDRAVRLRLRADVPVAVYLSGGLDSAVVAALARRQDKAPVHSFGIGFDDPAFDESAAQHALAERLGTRHHTVRCAPDDIAGTLEQVVWHGETPILRTAPAPLFRLAALVRDQGLRVVLTGEGADELFAGYDLFKQDAVRRFWARQPESAVRPSLFARIHAFEAMDGPKTSGLWQRYFRRGLMETSDPFYAHRLRWRATAWTLRLLSPSIRESVGDAPFAFDQELAEALPEGWWAWSPSSRAQAVEMLTFLVPYLLATQGDRVAMASGVETRYPFLDPEVIDLATAFPDRARRIGLRDKLVLRRLAERLLPAQTARQPKRPYRAPTTTALFSGNAKSWLDEELAPDQLRRYGLADVEAVGLLAGRARFDQGHMAGEREEMALVGVATLQRLARLMLEELPARLTAARERLDRLPCSVRIDATLERPAAGGLERSLRAC